MHKLFTVCTKQVRFPYTEHVRAEYKTPTHLDNSDKPDTKIVNFKHLESFLKKFAKWTESTAKIMGYCASILRVSLLVSLLKDTNRIA